MTMTTAATAATGATNTTVAPELRELVTVDLYNDIHKGIRAELFAVTTEAGRVDPADRAARAEVRDHVHSIVDLLVSHADHEDTAVQPALETHLPTLAARIAFDHTIIDDHLVGLRNLADVTAEAPRPEQRARAHQLYLELSSFTSAYLEHQDVEEQLVMPALEAAIGPEAVADIHQAIIASISPAEMAASLAVMIPAMNVDDRSELLGGMKAGAPADVFQGVWGLVGTVLSAAERDAVAVRLGLV